LPGGIKQLSKCSPIFPIAVYLQNGPDLVQEMRPAVTNEGYKAGDVRKNMRDGVSTGQKLEIPGCRDCSAPNQESGAVERTELPEATDPVVAVREHGKTKPHEKSQAMATVGQEISAGNQFARRATAIS